MRALQYTSPSEARLVEVPDPGCPEGGLLLRVEVSSICGSDIHFWHDRVGGYPAPPGHSGHECVGVVLEGTGLTPGTRVLALAPAHDGFAELLPASPESVILIPDGLSLERAVLGQQLGTVIYCCRKLPNVLDATVVVVGQGPAGLLFSMLLNRMGARTVIGVDVQECRLQMAAKVGVSTVIHAKKEEVADVVRARTQGMMADLVVEAVGTAETINLCAHLVRKHGHIALFGVPKTDVLPLDAEALLRKNVHIHTSVLAQHEPGLRSFRLALDMIATGRLDPWPLVTHRLPFRKIVEGLTLASTPDSGAVKVLLDH